MQILACPDLPPTLDAAYRRFEQMIEARDHRLCKFERAVDAELPDVKQYFDVNGGSKPGAGDAPIFDLRETMLDLLHAHVDKLSLTLLPDGRPLSSLLGPVRDHLLRMTIYPPADVAVVNHPHTDINLLTLLPAATASGLEVEIGGAWRSLSPAAGEIAVLAGEFIHLFGGCPAHRHRVLASATPRMSVSLFVNADPTLEIEGRTVGAIFDERLAIVADTSRKPTP